MAFTIWKGHLTFGLVSIPIKLVRAARAEKIHMHNLQRQTGARVRQVFVPSAGSAAVAAPPGPALVETKSQTPQKQRAPETPGATAAVSRSEMVRGFEFEKDKYVEFEPAELEKLAPAASQDMQIVEFVKFAEVDPVYLENSYYVVADKGGEKPYALLFAALKKTGYAAIGEFVMHRRDQIIIMRPGREGILAHTLFHEDEIKRENEFHADAKLVQPKEMELAEKLVEALAARFEPEKFKDKYRERLKAAISQKVESREVTEAPATAAHAPVVDIMAALKESLLKAKKPVATEHKHTAAKAPAKHRTSRAG